MKLKIKGLVLFILLSLNSEGAQGDFKFELIARANLNDTYQLPSMSFINNPIPMINDRGDIGFKILSYQGSNVQGVWYKKYDEPTGKIVYTTPAEKFLTDPFLTNDGKLIFTQYDEELSEGIFKFDSADYSTTQFFSPQNEEWLYYTYAQMNANGDLLFRATNQSGVRSFLKVPKNNHGQIETVQSEGTSTFGEKTSYLFKPTMNDSGAFSFKRRLGERGDWDEHFGDQILLMSPNGSQFDSQIIAEDRDINPQSKFLSFGHSTALSSHNSVAFTALIEDANGELKRGVFLYQNKTILTLALEGKHDVKEIESFSPKANNKGEVLFRAKDTQGLRSLYLASAENVVKVIGEGDLIEADRGQARILSNPNFPGFAGEIDINNNSEIVFSCLLIGNEDKKEWGTAIYKVTPK